jgi:hypothetical protein
LKSRNDVDLYIHWKIRDNLNLTKDIEKDVMDAYYMAVILTCHSIFQMSEKDCFNKVLKIDNKVLPLSKWSNETEEDAKKRHEDMFQNKMKRPFVHSRSFFYKSFIKNYPLNEWIKDNNVEFQNSKLL